MRFEIVNNKLIFINEKGSYTIPSEDIQRLVARSGTRVLRMADEDGSTTSTPLPLAVGEIEGYQLLSEFQLKASS